MGIKKIEIRMYGDEEVFTRPDVTMGICNELEESVKKSFPYGLVNFSFVLTGEKELAIPRKQDLHLPKKPNQ